MLSVDKFPCLQKQTRGNEFIPCSNNVCQILKCFRSFKIPAIPLIWPKSSYKQCYLVTPQCQGKWMAVRIAIMTSSMTFLSPYISRWWRQTCDKHLYFTVVNQWEARISTDHGINPNISIGANILFCNSNMIINGYERLVTTMLCWIHWCSHIWHNHQ